MYKISDRVRSIADKLEEVQEKGLLKSAEDYVKNLVNSGDIGKENIGRYILKIIKESVPFEGILPKNDAIINIRIQYDGSIREDDLAIILNRRDGRLKYNDKIVELIPTQVTDKTLWEYTKKR